MGMELMEVVQQEAEKKAEAAGLIQRALELLAGDAGHGSTIVRPPRSLSGKAWRPGYHQMVVQMLEKHGKPMSPAQLRDEMLKLPEFQGVAPAELRKALERSLFNAVRKDKADRQIEKHGTGLYWLVGRAVAGGKRQKAG